MLDRTYYGQTLDDLAAEINDKAMHPDRDEQFDHRYSKGDRRAMREGIWQRMNLS